MISRKTLHGRAQTYAMSIGPRPDPTGMYFGIYLTMRELRLFAATMKFNPLNKTVPSYVESWGFCNWTQAVGDIYDTTDMDSSIVWFPIPPENRTSIMVEAERHGFPEDRVVMELSTVQPGLMEGSQ